MFHNRMKMLMLLMWVTWSIDMTDIRSPEEVYVYQCVTFSRSPMRLWYQMNENKVVFYSVLSLCIVTVFSEVCKVASNLCTQLNKIFLRPVFDGYDFIIDSFYILSEGCNVGNFMPKSYTNTCTLNQYMRLQQQEFSVIYQEH